MIPLIIVGAGGFGLEIAAYIKDCGSLFDPKGFLDDIKAVGERHGGLPVLGPTDQDIGREAQVLIAVGLPSARRLLAKKFEKKGATFATLVHPSSYVTSSSQIGEGCILAPFSFVGAEATAGNHVLLNLYASIAHECAVGDYSALAPYAGMHAGSKIGEGVFLAAQSTVTSGVRIGANAKLAAGSVAYSEIPPNAEAFGNPARTRP